MLKRIWELHRTMILVGLFGLGIGTWLSADSGSFNGVILAKDGESLTVYKSTGEVVVLSSSKALSSGQIVMKRAGEACCDGADSSMDPALRVQLGERYERYWSTWSGTVEGFVMREHADDADTALVRSDDGSGLIRWKVWEGHLAGLRRGERLCKSAQAWAPNRCNPEAGIVEFKAPSEAP